MIFWVKDAQILDIKYVFYLLAFKHVYLFRTGRPEKSIVIFCGYGVILSKAKLWTK